MRTHFITIRTFISITREVKSRNERSIIDYVLISKRNRTDVKNVRIRRGAELYNDHDLLRAKIKMKSRRERKSIHRRRKAKNKYKH